MGKEIFGGLMFTLLGAGIFFWSFRKWSGARAKTAAAQYWAEATAVVDMADMRMTRQGCYPRIAYRFQAGGQTFTGNRLAFGNIVTRTKSALGRIMAPYPPGSWIRVRYNPHDPRDNVIEPRHVSGGMLVGAIAGAVVFTLGLFMFILGVL